MAQRPWNRRLVNQVTWDSGNSQGWGHQVGSVEFVPLLLHTPGCSWELSAPVSPGGGGGEFG